MIRIDYAEDSLVIEEDLPRVFNFISRGAKYEKWHFDYHLAAEVIDVKEGMIGSVFSIEELIGGFYLKHVGRIVEFERNRKFVWLGRFAIFPLVWIGTDFTFQEHPSGTPGERDPVLRNGALVADLDTHPGLPSLLHSCRLQASHHRRADRCEEAHRSGGIRRA